MPTASDRSRFSREAKAGSYRARDGPEREIQKTERRKDRDGFTELAVIRRQPSSERGVVHARQIVEDQRRGVHELGCGGGSESLAGVSPHSSADNIVRTGLTRFEGA